MCRNVVANRFCRIGVGSVASLHSARVYLEERAGFNQLVRRLLPCRNVTRMTFVEEFSLRAAFASGVVFGNQVQMPDDVRAGRIDHRCLRLIILFDHGVNIAAETSVRNVKPDLPALVNYFYSAALLTAVDVVHRSDDIIPVTRRSSRQTVLLDSAQNLNPSFVLRRQLAYFAFVCRFIFRQHAVAFIVGRVSVTGQSKSSQSFFGGAPHHFLRRVVSVAVACVGVKIRQSFFIQFQIFVEFHVSLRHLFLLHFVVDHVP